jgi:SPP1 gp7 family putative phage head morphogenesis protein
MRRKFVFSTKRSKQLKKGQQVEGPILLPAVALQDKFVKSWLRQIDAMHKDINKQVIQMFKSPLSKETYAQDNSLGETAKELTDKITNKWLKVFDKFSANWADKMTDDFNKQAGRSLQSSLKKLSGGLTIKADAINERTNNIMISGAAEAASLIKSISSEHLSKVSEGVLRSVRDPAAGGLSGLIKEIQKNLDGRYKRTKNHAKNVALDQTRKMFNSLNAARMQDAGIDEFKWIHSGGSKEPRKDHVAMNNNIYRFDDPPVIDKQTGERGLPGQAYYCRCMMRPVIRFSEEVDGEKD